MLRSLRGVRPVVLALVTAVVTLTIGAGPAAAAGCGAHTLKARYAYAFSGFKTQGDTAAQRTPFAQAGHEIYDGKGGVVGNATGSYNGTIVRIKYTGTYTINADCSGSVTTTDDRGEAAHYDIFVPSDGSSILYIQSDSGVVSAGWERRE